MYTPRSTLPEQPQDLAGLVKWAVSFPAWVMAELRNVAAEFVAPKTSVRLQRLYANPARMEADALVLLDATHPDASAGEGLYIRNAANTAWTKV
jgi:hypothetical protein